MKTKIYVATRYTGRQRAIAFCKEVAAVAAPTCRWWSADVKVQVPYLSHQGENAGYARAMLAAIDACDVFVLIADRRCYDAMAEFGYALSARKPCIVLQADGGKQSLFLLSAQVYVARSVDEAAEVLEKFPEKKWWPALDTGQTGPV